MRNELRRLTSTLSVLFFAIAACGGDGQVERIYGDTAPHDTAVVDVVFDVVQGDTLVDSDTATQADTVVPQDTYAPPDDTVVGQDTAPADDTTTAEDTYAPPQDTYTPPQDTYVPPEDTYVPPQDTYTPPQETYTPPQDTYVPPQDTYTPPQDTYVPPQDTYVPPQDTYTPPEDTTQPPLDPQSGYFDVIVVGAGTGGVSAAIEAARRGRTVALLEETDWLGGQMTAAAVTSMDEGGANKDSGIYADFVARVKAHYQNIGRPVGTCYWSNGTTCFEPRVGRQILAQMVAEQPKVHLFYRTRITHVDTTWANGHTRVTGVRADQHLANGDVQPWFLAGAITIDATETGDVLALGPASYRLGRHISSNLYPGDCVQDMTWTAVIKRYSGGAPWSLRVTSPPPGYTSAVAAHFASVVAEGGADWLNGSNSYPVSWDTHTGYRGMPDSTGAAYTSSTPWLITRTGVNWANDSGLTVGDLEAEDRGRAAFCEARLRTLQFIYYLQNTLGRTDWSVADDEGFDTAYNQLDNDCPNIPSTYDAILQHFPVMPYVREGRRLIGITTVKASQIRREVHCAGCPKRAVENFTDAIAVGDYAVDLHGCNGAGDLESFESTSDVPAGWATGAFQVPMSALIPASVDGLLAAEKNLSVSRLVNGAIRLQPITMLTGQAAGTLAALSIERGEQPRAVPSLLVQEALLERGCRLSLQSYADVPRSDPAWKDTQLLAARGAMIGYDDLTFGPDDVLTREQAAALIIQTFDYPVPSPLSTPTFSDVDPTRWSYPYIEALYSAGLTAGCATNPPQFCPSLPLKRAELATFIVRGLGLDPSMAPGTPYFNDLPDSASHWAWAYIQKAAQYGLIDGCGGGDFCPEAPVTRRAAAATIRRVLRRLTD